ncbi:tetraacyldisaccharide 4'-kinase [Achlya hypogyna]|uniref:tetraacyldisaccharide 4'-kinase n=1 Tax=Achlya hypogyna TaxID=1202772 RepID=A0A1V9ZD73_ACHHY|nr:tetraacyldisaccharide 4'-kinase [Achlya hypogyna]
MVEQWQRAVRKAVWQQLMLERDERHPLVRSILLAASFAYGSIAAFRRSHYASQPRQVLPLRTISFGNVTWGGTGKTPCLHFVARRLAAKNHPLMLVSRGYGDDEWRVFASEFPGNFLALGKERYRNVMMLVESQRVPENTVALVDDGFQQYSLHKDLDIVMINAYNPFGSGALLPEGQLRELPEEALPRADIVILHHADNLSTSARVALEAKIRPMLKSSALLATSRMRLTALPAAADAAACVQNREAPLPAVNEQDATLIVGLCGIGCPASFRDVLVRAFPQCEVLMQVFPDHYDYSSADVDLVVATIEATRGSRNVVAVVTEKDFYRSQALLQAHLAAYDLRVALCQLELVQERDAVLGRIDALLDQPLRRRQG